MLSSAEMMNKDGGGIAWNDGKFAHWRKGLDLTAEKMMELIESENMKRDIIIHFRITTDGGTRDELCHPFPLGKKEFPHTYQSKSGKSKKGVLFHNGIWSDWQEKLEHFVLSNNIRIPDGHMSDTSSCAFIAGYVGDNYCELTEEKMTIMTPTGIKTYAQSEWTEVNGIECSNDYFNNSYSFNFGGNVKSTTYNTKEGTMTSRLQKIDNEVDNGYVYNEDDKAWNTMWNGADDEYDDYNQYANDYLMSKERNYLKWKKGNEKRVYQREKFYNAGEVEELDSK